ncbi:hypothetical protein niasHS_014298 [Heterodera schachtii]|uniref:ADAM10 endopeptidase n=1 Tax=Heterodera schachtii TaxID=97005 RepID=A0ABD2INI6_HETSC
MRCGARFSSILLSLILLLVCFDLGVCLNKYVDHYETLSYQPVVDRQKRSLETDHEDTHGTDVDLHFRSHNRTFHLKLRPLDFTNSLFTDDHIIDVDGVHHTHLIRPNRFLYEGQIVGDPTSFVHGTLLDGVFDGFIFTGDGRTFTVEKAARYFDIGQRPAHFHSFIYADEEINHKRFRRTKRDTDEDGRDNDQQHHEPTHGCGLTKQRAEQMLDFQQSADHRQHSSRQSPFSSYMKHHQTQQHHSLRHGDNDVEDAIELLSFPQRYLGKNRTRREQSLKPEWREIRGKRIYEVRTCTIYLQADHKLYMHVYNKEGNRDHARTREEIVSLLYNHIKAVNSIYENTDFHGINGINFAIQRTTIYTPDTCAGASSANSAATVGNNPFCEENVDVSHYLNSNSQKDHSAFCLAYSLTYRDFLGGTLGLAWVASPSQSTAGGICQRFQRYNEQQRGGVNRSLNTGIITLVNYGNRVPPRVSQLTLAHEIGHNFGSPHDFPADCQPGLPDGNFIMFASATSGDKPNNSKFSKCSVANISEVLYEVLGQSPKNQQFGRKKNCFTDQLKSFCGNQIREDGEECDCGFTKQDCHENQDQCCAPRENNDERTMCRRLAGKKCSPSEGICCRAADCSFVQRNGRVCREESECQHEQKCDGTQAKCPDSRNKPDGKACQESTKVCQNGSCSGSICAHHGMRDCFLTEGKPEDLCQLACQTEAGCQAAADIPRLTVYTQEGRKSGHLLLPPGSPCNDYQGYCDIFRKCRSVDSNGPLSRLRTLLFNSEKIQEFKEWVKEYWWACVLIGIFVIMLMALFVKCCAVHTPSTNPNKLPAQHFSDTLRHPGTLLRRGQSRPPVVVGSGGNDADARRGAREMRAVVPPGAGAGRASRPTTTRAATATAANNNSSAAMAPRTSRSATAAAGAHHPTRGAPPATTAASAAPMATTESPLIQIPVEPPPPYQPTDPASTAGATPSAPTITIHHHRLPSATTAAVVVPGVLPQQQPMPAALPGAPPPAQPTAAASSSTVPLIPGPPMPGQGPRPGRRKPRASPQKQLKKDGTGAAVNHHHRDASNSKRTTTTSSTPQAATNSSREKDSKQRNNKRTVK